MTFPSPDDIHNILLNLEANALWVLGTFLFSAIVGIYFRDQGRFTGRWAVTITWDQVYAESLFGEHVEAPHSGGRIALTHGCGAGNDQYWGMGYFELRASTTQYAQLCVELDNIKLGYKIFNFGLPFLFARELKSFDLHSLVREKTREFNYGPWVQYRMVFKEVSINKLEGEMVLINTGERVGDVSATRTT